MADCLSTSPFYTCVSFQPAAYFWYSRLRFDQHNFVASWYESLETVWFDSDVGVLVMETLDANKLFDMALEASQANDTQKSIGYIKEAIDQSPDDARMWYMLGTLYADIGIYDKAVQNMEKAIEVDSDYGIARFHLGLMQLISGDQQTAETTWAPLDKLGATHYLSLFKTGLIKIAKDDVEAGIDLIRTGIENNHLNESLNKDMEMVVENATLSLSTEADI
jgi:tetratricopeptide (TPR) repeat protein